MKKRNGFVSNSSSSSFMIMRAGSKLIIESGDTEADFEVDSSTFEIDYVIKKLQEAKDEGATTVTVQHGGGMDY